MAAAAACKGPVAARGAMSVSEDSDPQGRDGLFREDRGRLMKTAIRAGALALTLFPLAPALAAEKACEQLKSEIAAKLEAKGVTSYALDIVPTETPTSAKVIGDCDRGTRKVTYKKVRLISS